jgi:hypothetical protein
MFIRTNKKAPNIEALFVDTFIENLIINAAQKP